jgi:hypothetical protein
MNHKEQLNQYATFPVPTFEIPRGVIIFRHVSNTEMTKKDDNCDLPRS